MDYCRRTLDKGILQNILDSFVELTGIRTAYFSEYQESINGKDKDICSFCKTIRQNSTILERCNECDRQAFKTVEKTGKPHLYQCHMGIWESVIPLYARNNLCGFLMLGQVRCADTCSVNSTRKRLEDMLTDRILIERAVKAYAKISCLPHEKIKAAVDMLAIIARYIIDTDVIHVYDMEAVEKAKQFLKANYTRHNISTRNAALEIGLSPSYLSFLFRRETGLTVTRFVENLRISKAKHLLETTSKTVNEISFETGYSDQNYFSRTFRKHMGTSPTEYRKRLF